MREEKPKPGGLKALCAPGAARPLVAFGFYWVKRIGLQRGKKVAREGYRCLISVWSHAIRICFEWDFTPWPWVDYMPFTCVGSDK